MNKEILFPVFALAFWTIGVLFLIPIARFKAVFAKQASADDFKFGESDRVPEQVKLANRNYMNLLELPILFYVISLISYVRGHYGVGMVWLAWTYVGLRILHTIIHLNGNLVRLRFIAFALSLFILISMWVIGFMGILK